MSQPSEMAILDLVLKSHWYELIKSGQKHAEYREIKPYWSNRLFSKPYTHVRFRRGYTKEAMLFELAGIEVCGKDNDLKREKAYKLNLGNRVICE